MVQHSDKVLRGHVIEFILEVLDTWPQRLVVIPVVAGLGARRFLDRLATHLPTGSVRVVSVLPWEKETAGSLTAQLTEISEDTVIFIHDFDQADEFSRQSLIRATKRSGRRIVATVTSDVLHSFADDIVSLTPFTLPETDQFARSLTGSKLPALLVEELHRITDGRPDYIADILNDAPRDRWSDPDASLSIPQSWYEEFNRVVTPLDEETRTALFSRPLKVDALTTAITAGVIELRMSEDGQVPAFRDPRFAAITQGTIPVPPRAANPVARERLLLNKAETHASELALASTELFLQDCTGLVDTTQRDALTGYIAMYGGQRHQAGVFLKPRTSSVSQSSAASIYELADWNPSGLKARAKHTQTLTDHADAEFEEAQVHALFADILLHRTKPDRLPNFAHAVTRERLNMFLGWAALADDDPITARERLRPVPGGDLSVSLWRDALLARSLFVLGQWGDAKVVVERGLAACDLHGVSLLEPWLLWTGSLIAAMEGELSLARSYLRRATSGTDAFTIQRLPAAMGRMIVSANVMDLSTSLSAAEELGRAVEHRDTQQPGFWPWEDVYAQTLLRAGRIEEADRVVSEAEERNAPLGLASLTAKNLVPRAFILLQRGKTTKAISLLDDATAAIEHSPMPAYAARILLEYGLLLRRMGRRSHADDILRRASDLFAEMGAHVMVQRCNQERRISGVGGHTHNQLGLTAQEEQVAQLAADGTTNREIALQLTLSPKTVEYHLTNIYKKLQVKGRSELRRMLSC